MDGHLVDLIKDGLVGLTANVPRFVGNIQTEFVYFLLNFGP